MRKVLFAFLAAMIGALFVQMDTASAESRRDRDDSDRQSYSRSSSKAKAQRHARSRHGQRARYAQAKRKRSYASREESTRKRRVASEIRSKAGRSSLGVQASTERPRRQRSVASTGGGSSGLASFYWQPQRVASGGWFNPNAMTAAHKTLPFGTKVRVTHAGNGKSVVVTINDRGPYIAGRVIDLSKAAAGVISMQGQGVAPVKLEVLGR